MRSIASLALALALLAASARSAEPTPRAPGGAGGGAPPPNPAAETAAGPQASEPKAEKKPASAGKAAKGKDARAKDDSKATAPPAEVLPEVPKPLSKAEERAKLNPRAVGMPGAERLAGYERRLRMEKDSPLAGLRPRSIGPEVQGGRIVDLESPARYPDTLFVAFASGGLFKTENRGGSWKALFDQESSMTIGDIALGDVEGRVIWVGTGESNSSRTSYSGTGVFKSTDGGGSWKNVGLPDSHHVGRILVDRRKADTVFVAAMGPLYTESAERGVYKTTDGGATWRKTLFVDERTGAIDLAQHPSRPEVVYAAMWERDRKPWNFLESGPGSGIYRSTDGGETWQKAAGGFPQGDAVGRIGLAVSPSRPDLVYAVVDNQERRPETEPVDEETPPGELTPRRLRKLTAAQVASLDPAVLGRFLKDNGFPKDLKAKALQKDLKDGKTRLADLLAYLSDADRALFEADIVGPEVYRSDDQGTSWKRTHEGRIEKVFYTYGYYFGRVHVAPDNPNEVYVAGVPMLKSTDGGKSWKGLDERGVHGDHHALLFDPASASRLALGNDGGLNLSWDRGETWVKVNNLPVGQFTTVVVDSAEPYNVLGGLQDNGVMRGPSTYVYGKTDPQAWKPIFGGDGSCVQVDPKDVNVVYAASQFGFASRLNLKTQERASIRPRAELKGKPLRFNWVTPFLVSPHSREILYFGTNRLHRSLDRGETWAFLSPDLTSSREQGDVPYGTLTSIAESPKKFGVIWVGTDEGKVWGTRDGGVTWKDLGAGLAESRWVTRVVASAHDEGTVYVTQSGYRNDDFAPYVFRSTDYGDTWTSLAKDLPAEPVNVLREDPSARHLLYLGTDVGAFASLDAGATWTPVTGGLPHVPVHDLAVHPKKGDLVLGTHGRSVWVADAAPLRELTDEVRKKDLHAFKVENAKWKRDRGYGEHPYVDWYRIPEKVRIAWWSGAAAVGPAKITVKDSLGNVWKELAATSTAGFNAVDYDISADPARADAAEAAARKRDADKAKAADELKKKFAPAGKADADGDGDEGEGAGEKEKPTPPELVALLADPLRAKRTRYLAPGTYTVEVTAGGKSATTKLVVKAEKEGSKDEDDDEAEGSER